MYYCLSTNCVLNHHVQHTRSARALTDFTNDQMMKHEPGCNARDLLYRAYPDTYLLKLLHVRCIGYFAASGECYKMPVSMKDACSRFDWFSTFCDASNTITKDGTYGLGREKSRTWSVSANLLYDIHSESRPINIYKPSTRLKYACNINGRSIPFLVSHCLSTHIHLRIHETNMQTLRMDHDTTGLPYIDQSKWTNSRMIYQGWEL